MDELSRSNAELSRSNAELSRSNAELSRSHAELEQRLERIERACSKMSSHIDFVESVYLVVRRPFNYLLGTRMPDKKLIEK